MTHPSRRLFKLSTLAAAGLVGLAACATSTPYSAVDTSGYGFSEQRIEDNRYRIVFRGNSLTDRETVENYLLFRAAEVTVQSGYDHFIVVEDDTERSTTYTRTADYSSFRYYGYGRPFPYYGYGYPWGPGYTDYTIRERHRYTAMAYILLGRGDKPQGKLAAYDARQVINNLRPIIVWPEGS